MLFLLDKMRKDAKDGIFLYIRTALFLLSGISLNRNLFYYLISNKNIFKTSLGLILILKPSKIQLREKREFRRGGF